MEEADLLLEQKRSIELMRRRLHTELEGLLKRKSVEHDGMTADVSIVVSSSCHPRFHLAISLLPASKSGLSELELANDLAEALAGSPYGQLIELVALNGARADISSVEVESYGENNSTP